MPLNVDVNTLVQIWEALVLNVSLEEMTTSTHRLKKGVSVSFFVTVTSGKPEYPQTEL